MVAIKDYLQKLVSTGQIEEALRLLAEANNNDAILLMGNYNNAKTQYNRGMLEFGEWSRVLARTNYALLEVSKSLSGPVPAHWLSSSNAEATSTEPGPRTAPVPPPTETGNPKPGKTVFISYNHADGSTAEQVRDLLEAEGLNVILDRDDMRGGQSIMAFIQDSIKRADAVVSLVSSKSLQSGWVGQESAASLYAVWLADKKFVPLQLDYVVFDADFQITALETLQAKIKELDVKTKKIQKLGADARDLQEDRQRLFDLQKNFSAVIQRFKNVLMLDISGDKLSKAKDKILAAING